MTNINNSYLNANTLTIAGTKIKQDADGRFCLNDCHKASNTEKTKQPSNWLRLDSTSELIAEIRHSSDVRTDPITTINGGTTPGTYAVKELVYAYAMWISPAFHLQVIRAYDDLINGRLQEPQFEIPKSYAEALRLASDQAEQLKELKPKGEVYDRIVLADGSLCITDAAKVLQVKPKFLFNWLKSHGWIYRRPGNGHWGGYSEKSNRGYLEHKVTEVHRTDGSEKITEQVRITPKGLTKLSHLLSSDMENV